MTTSQVKASKTATEIQEAWKDQGVRYVICELPDLAGMSRSKVIPLSRLKDVAEHGLRMIGLMVTCDSATNVVPETHYGEERNYGDAILKPDLSTAQIVPWWPLAARVICDPYWPDSSPLESAPRMVLKRVLDRLQARGLTAKIAVESEFYLLQDATSRTPVFDVVHIFNTGLNFSTPVTTRLLDLLPEGGIDVLTLNCEYGTGQYEITYREQEGIVAADQAYTFKQAVKEIAHQEGYHATFMTKPFPEQSASGSHIHISLWDKQGRNVMEATSGSTNGLQGLSETALHFIAGMLAHAPTALAFASPTPNCYSRFAHHSFAPVNLSWGIDDRTAMVRAKPTGDGGTHIENRLPSGLSNPYLAIAAVLASGLLGLEAQLMPHDLSSGPAEENEQLKELPNSLQAALVALEEDTALQSVLGEELVDIFLKVKRQELERQETFIQEDKTKNAEAAAQEWQLQEYIQYY